MLLCVQNLRISEARFALIMLFIWVSGTYMEETQRQGKLWNQGSWERVNDKMLLSSEVPLNLPFAEVCVLRRQKGLPKTEKPGDISWDLSWKDACTQDGERTCNRKPLEPGKRKCQPWSTSQGHRWPKPSRPLHKSSQRCFSTWSPRRARSKNIGEVPTAFAHPLPWGKTRVRHESKI
jgi:hypothetical protein